MMNWMRNLLVLGLLGLSSACSMMPAPVQQDPNYAVMPVPAVDQQPKSLDGAIYSVHRPVKMFEDTKARRVGDILTVLLSEKTNATTKSATNTAKDGSMDLGIPTIFGRGVVYNGDNIMENAADTTRAFTGSGDSSQSNSLTGELTVTVTHVLSNGNLVVAGEKIININQGAEFVRLSGVIRPEDINGSNTVLSSKVANAQISYGGGGALADANSQGWLSRFFNSEWWPF